MRATRWGVLGPGAISGDFARALQHSRHGRLYAVGSSVGDRAAAFAAVHGAERSGTYDQLLAMDDVDAVYIGTVHTTHAELAVRALEAGKAVLCEKPASPSIPALERVLDTAQRTRRPFVEAFKTRFGPFADAVREFSGDGELGEPTHVTAGFGFDAGTRSGRLFDPALAGGAILDVGCYPASFAVEVAAAARIPICSPGVASVTAAQEGGVDAATTAVLELGPLRAHVGAAIVAELPRSATVRFAGGELFLPDAWGSRTRSPSTLVVRGPGGERTIEVPVVRPMAAEADAVSRALAEGTLEAPEMPWSHTRAVARILAQWRAAALAG